MKLRIMNYELRITKYRVLLFVVLLLIPHHSSLLTAASAAKWGGVDESVVEKFAEEHGRAPVDPVINTDQGDLLLFMFLIGGLAGGFAAGCYWRMLTEKKDQCTAQDTEKCQENKIVGM